MATRIKPGFLPENYKKEKFLKLMLFKTFQSMFNDPRVFRVLPNNQGTFAESNAITIPSFPTGEILAGKQLKLAVLIQKDTQPFGEVGVAGPGGVPLNSSFRVSLILHAVGDYPQFHGGKYNFKNYTNNSFLNQYNVVAYVSLKLDDEINVLVCTDLWNRTKMNNSPRPSEYTKADAAKKEAHDEDVFDAEYTLTQGIGLEMLCLATSFVIDMKTSIMRRYQGWIAYASAFDIATAKLSDRAANLLLMLSRKNSFKIVDTDSLTKETTTLSEQNPQQFLNALIGFYSDRPERSDYEQAIMIRLAAINVDAQTGRYTKTTLASDLSPFIPLFVADANEDVVREYYEGLDFVLAWKTSNGLVMRQDVRSFLMNCNEYLGNQQAGQNRQMMGTGDAMMVIDNNHTEGLMSYFKPKEIDFFDAIYKVLHNDNTIIFKLIAPPEYFQISYYIGKMSPVMYAWIAAKARIMRKGFRETGKETQYVPIEEGKGNSTHVSTDILARLLTYDGTSIKYINPLGVYSIDIEIMLPNGLKNFSDIKYSNPMTDEQRLIHLIEAAYKQYYGNRAIQLRYYPSMV